MSYTKEQIEKWKEEYGPIYSTYIADKQYIFKTLDRDDYINISLKQATNPAGFDYELETVSTCLLSEYNPDELKKKAGICSTLYEKIMSKSGFQEVETEEL